MQRRIILIVLLMSKMITAMDTSGGTWDEYGNYLGPVNYPEQQPYFPNNFHDYAVQPPQPGWVLVPVFIDEYGQPLAMPPVLPTQEIPSYVYGLPPMLPQFSYPQYMNHMPCPLPPVLDADQLTEVLSLENQEQSVNPLEFESSGRVTQAEADSSADEEVREITARIQGLATKDADTSATSYAHPADMPDESLNKSDQAHMVEQTSYIAAQAETQQDSYDEYDAPDDQEDDFYKGYKRRAAEVAIRSDGKRLPAVVGRTSIEGDANLVKKKKALTPQQPKKKSNSKTVQKNRQPKKAVDPSPVAQIIQKKQPKELPLKERVEKLFNGNHAQIREGLALLEQAAEGEIPGVDEDFRLTALHTLGSYYLYGYPDKHNPKLLVIEQNPERAEYFIKQAVDAGSVFALADMLPLSFECRRQDVHAYADRLEHHEQADDLLKQTARVYRAAVDLVDDEQGQFAGQALDSFRRMHDYFSFNTSLDDIANRLPKSFYVWAHERIPDWYARLDNTSPDKSSINDATAEWLYIIGRLELEGSVQKFGENADHAMKWIKAAGRYGNQRARIFLATPALDNNPRSHSLVYDRIEYLRYARSNLQNCSPEEKKHLYSLSRHYGFQGFLDPLNDYLAMDVSDENLDDALKDLEKNFPIIRIPHDNIGTHRIAHAAKLIDKLVARAPQSWVARAILCALEISRFRDHRTEKFVPSLDTLIALDNALQIQKDVQAHPQLNAIVGAGYSTRAFVLKRLGVSTGGAQLMVYMRQAVTDFKRSVALGDSFGMVAYGMLLHTSDGKIFGRTNAGKEGLALLDKLINSDEDGGHKESVLDHLVTHFSNKCQWDKANFYLQKALELAKAYHHYEREEHLRGCQETIYKGLKSPKQSRHQLRQQHEKQAKEDRDLVRIAQAERYISIAAQEAQGNPIKALGNLRLLKDLGVGDSLYRYARSLACCGMAIEDVRTAALDEKKVTHTKLKEQLLRGVDELESWILWILNKYQDRREQRDFAPEPFDELLHNYLMLYHLKILMEDVVLKNSPEKLMGAWHALLEVMPEVKPLLSDIDITDIPQDQYSSHIIKMISNTLSEARAAYQAVCKAKEVGQCMVAVKE